MSVPTNVNESQWEEATRCPKCANPGEEVAVNKPVHQITGLPDRTSKAKVYTFKCITALCRWFDTTWIVQVRDDGTIPTYAPGEKQFNKLSAGIASRAEGELQQLRDLGLA